MTRLVIVGMGDAAELAEYYFRTDSDYEIVAFTADRSFISTPTFLERPVVPFDELPESFPPEQHHCFVAIGYSHLNKARKAKYEAAKALGYSLASYVSPRSVLLNDGMHGDNCFILESNTIQPFVRIGNDVTMWSGNHIGHHSIIHDHCFITSEVVVAGRVEIGAECFIGVNATLKDNISIGPRCVIGAGALVLADAEEGGVYAAEATPRSKIPSGRLRRI
jgi:sugar O-acyltransferase (sialic acid O-acetyltransferase NeuD family)